MYIYACLSIMAKLYFYYSAMNSGKTTILIQSAFNYEERNMRVEVFVPEIMGSGVVKSRIGLERKAHTFNINDDLYDMVNSFSDDISCIMIDEAQFLKKKQVYDLCRVCDELNIPVLCYGLRIDFRGEPFEGSAYLLSMADKLVEIKTICLCGKKASMNMRKVKNENITDLIPIFDGEQIEIGGNDNYISLCRRCYMDIKKQCCLIMRS